MSPLPPSRLQHRKGLGTAARAHVKGFTRHLPYAFAAVLLVCSLRAAAESAPCLGGLPGLQAEFQQTVRTEEGDIVQEMTGVLEVLPPNRLRWEIKLPESELLLVDGSSLWHHQPSLSQATRYPLDFSSPLFLLLGDGEKKGALAKKYRVQSSQGKDGHPVHRFEAREEGGDFSRFELAFAARCLPHRLSWEDSLGQRTEVRFRQVLRTRLAPEHFRFSPPPGTALAVPAL